MKRTLKMIPRPNCRLALVSAVALLISCEKGFEEVNTNPDASTQIIPEYVFSKSQYDAASNQLHGLQGAMQYTTSYNEIAGFGAKYIFNQGTAPYTVFNNGYPNEINEIGEVIRAVSGSPEQVNKLAVARIWRVYCFHRMTDLYGEIPYSEAGRGYSGSVFKPKYDRQEEIYRNMLNELEEAPRLFDTAKPTFGGADVVYGGDILKWKRFANSLMLRLALRLTKVNPALAESWVRKAVSGELITEAADIARIRYQTGGQDINKNPLALYLLNTDYIRADGYSNPEGGKYQKTFIDFLKTTGDPRLGVLSVVYVNQKPDTTAALQKGMASSVSSKPADFVTYSEPNPATLLRLDAPMLLLTPAEVNLLLAEAAVRGWYSEAPAARLFENGTRAGLRQWALYGSAGVIPESRIEAYLKAHPFRSGGTPGQQLEQIHTQFWIALFPNAQEVFSNWRRTGYPTLRPNVYPGNSTGGQIFRRMLYPPTEENLNPDEYGKAIARQGPNTFMTRVWWDK
ncbi:SusD/RagB family nutrient-binding outer membrane lipoprotein [Larkinella soli]|uniref:SusD/RagB family nutrient-binding outer membrane lipoprotein n=1 Tax=Larkinella soli TaxID=1770527 RepID=UPI001E5EC172|nr:SusD/RagB family nutrient-binding outer membrane lipoprotein [Larkinella soli]